MALSINKPRNYLSVIGTVSQAAFLLVEGPISAEQGVWNIKGRRFTELSLSDDQVLPPGHDFR